MSTRVVVAIIDLIVAIEDNVHARYAASHPHISRHPAARAAVHHGFVCGGIRGAREDVLWRVGPGIRTGAAHTRQACTHLPLQPCAAVHRGVRGAREKTVEDGARREEAATPPPGMCTGEVERKRAAYLHKYAATDALGSWDVRLEAEGLRLAAHPEGLRLEADGLRLEASLKLEVKGFERASRAARCLQPATGRTGRATGQGVETRREETKFAKSPPLAEAPAVRIRWPR
ncbi:hypothetical protein GGX14DRAFT_406595 [Mycena pura]|uniref:Uncharacterized protein n=1 Tax=Mycena pura TaxID=153505 RepID=A0AAD6UU68_9AGAR|nr:hypothetical protein GGX14DRAFT_406595 [Mycena pura]